MANLFLALLLLPALVGANPAFALELCAKIDKDTGEPRDGATIKLRATCRVKKNGDPVEVSIGTTEQLAAIATNTTDIATNRSDISANTAALADKAELPCATQVGTDVVFEGCNVHVRSGEGATWGTGTRYAGTVNGLGNLVVGYDEKYNEDKTGSHNLVVGPFHSYPSYGGFIAGSNNTVSGVYSAVSGGFGSEASGIESSVSGGGNNLASGMHSSVSGGTSSGASGDGSAVSGGSIGEASGEGSSVTGGQYNYASSDYSTAP